MEKDWTHARVKLLQELNEARKELQKNPSPQNRAKYERLAEAATQSALAFIIT